MNSSAQSFERGKNLYRLATYAQIPYKALITARLREARISSL